MTYATAQPYGQAPSTRTVDRSLHVQPDECVDCGVGEPGPPGETDRVRARPPQPFDALSADDDSREAATGDYLVIPAARYDLAAIDDCAVLLSVVTAVRG